MRWSWNRIASRFFRSQLLGLTVEEIVDLGQRAEGEGAVLRDEGLEPRGRVARHPADGEDDAVQLLLRTPS